MWSAFVGEVRSAVWRVAAVTTAPSSRKPDDDVMISASEALPFVLTSLSGRVRRVSVPLKRACVRQVSTNGRIFRAYARGLQLRAETPAGDAANLHSTACRSFDQCIDTVMASSWTFVAGRQRVVTVVRYSK